MERGIGDLDTLPSAAPPGLSKRDWGLHHLHAFCDYVERNRQNGCILQKTMLHSSFILTCYMVAIVAAIEIIYCLSRKLGKAMLKYRHDR